MPKAKLAAFRTRVEPVLKRVCVVCHGPEKQKGKLRIDTLDPDLQKGKDVNWWLEVFDVISNGEMPPEDAEMQLADAEKGELSIGCPARFRWRHRCAGVSRGTRRSGG